MPRSVFLGCQEVTQGQGVYWGGRCEGERRLGEELGPVQSEPGSGGRYQPLLNYMLLPGRYPRQHCWSQGGAGLGSSLRCQLGESFPQRISSFLRKVFTWALRLPGLGCLERKAGKGVELYPFHPPVVSPVRFSQSKHQCISMT